MNMTNKEYLEYTKTYSPNSTLVKDSFFAFLFGGTICVLGQAVLNAYVSLGMSADSASSATAMTMVFVGAFLTGLGIYKYLAKYGGAGTLVPITGFANAIVSPAMEFKSEGYVLGVGARMFIIAGPVIVYGIISSIIYGLVVYIFKLY